MHDEIVRRMLHGCNLTSGGACHITPLHRLVKAHAPLMALQRVVVLGFHYETLHVHVQDHRSKLLHHIPSVAGNKAAPTVSHPSRYIRRWAALADV